MSRRTHFLKISPRYFGDVVSGDKMFEIRKDDRGFMLYDTLVLMEYSDSDGFSGNFTVVSVQYILTSKDFPEGIKDEYCILGLTPGQMDYERDLIPEARRANVEPCALRHPFKIRHRMVILWVH